MLHASKARSLKTEEEIVAIRYGIKVVEERLDEMLEMETWNGRNTAWVKRCEQGLYDPQFFALLEM